MIKSFFISFLATLGVIFTIHNIYEVNASLDRCEQYIAQIEAAQAYYNENIANKTF
jgi:hypothetical protein